MFILGNKILSIFAGDMEKSKSFVDYYSELISRLSHFLRVTLRQKIIF